MFYDMCTQFKVHRIHGTSPLILKGPQSSAGVGEMMFQLCLWGFFWLLFWGFLFVVFGRLVGWVLLLLFWFEFCLCFWFSYPSKKLTAIWASFFLQPNAELHLWWDLAGLRVLAKLSLLWFSGGLLRAAWSQAAGYPHVLCQLILFKEIYKHDLHVPFLGMVSPWETCKTVHGNWSHVSLWIKERRL